MAGDITDSSLFRSIRRRLTRQHTREQVSPVALTRSSELRSWVLSTRHASAEHSGTAPSTPDPLPFSVEEAERAGRPVFESLLVRVPLAANAGAFSGNRYDITDTRLGEGGMGTVMVAYDKVLEREVALKLPHTGFAQALLTEARLTARLGHPNIVPVYDLVVTQDGHYGYVMRRLLGERLSDVLRGLRRGEPARVEAYGRFRLLTIFSQVVAAVAYAHDSRVIHRDLKPNNIMIGYYGEVVLLDWGLARRLDASPEDTARLPFDSSSGFVGAPAYISPEQLENREVDERSDVYSLGAILYDLLTYRPPFEHEPWEDKDLFYQRIRTQSPMPPSTRAPERRIPAELEAICLRCLARHPDDRYQTAMAIHKDVAMFLEGTREQEWRRKLAEDRTQDALRLVERYERRVIEATRYRKEALLAETTVNPWDPIDRKREVWNLQHLANQAETESLEAFFEAEKTFHQALGHDIDHRPAREKLLDLYWRRFLQAERNRNLSEMQQFEARVRLYDEEGRYAIRLKGDGRLLLESNPGGAEITVYTYREVDRVLRPVNPRNLGSGIVKVELPVGSYLVKLKLRGYREVLYPLCISRLETVEARVCLFKEEELGTDFIQIPAGVFRMGGDPEAYSLDLQLRWVEDFAISRHPVTALQYLEFLNDQHRRNPTLARRHVPRENQKPDPLWTLGEDGLYHLPEHEDEEGHRWLPDYPIFFVSWDDAMAYCQWKSEKDGRAYRLPTGEEWEKAARGVDGRFFPWGDRFDATFCKNRESRRGPPCPESVGAYLQDESPYGVRDMAGGVSDWTTDWYNEARESRLVKGGNWTVHDRTCRLARRTAYRPEGTNVSIGFRLCNSLSPRW